MKLLVALALVALLVISIVVGVVSLVAGGKAGLSSGVALIAVFVVFVLAVLVAIYWIKNKLKKAFQGLADATKGAAGTVLPEVITMQPVRLADEDFDTGEMDGLSEELRRLGYQDVGEFKIPEMSVEPCLRAFLNPASQTYAVVYHADAVSPKPWVDIVTRFGESNGLTTTTAAMSGLLNKPPKLRSQKFPDATMTELVAKHNERVTEIVSGEGEQSETLTADGFVERFLAAYHEERRFREAQGGPTEEEVRRVASATPGGEETSDEVIAAATEVMREAQQANAEETNNHDEREEVPAPNFEEAAKQPAFQKVIEEVAKLCGSQPRPLDRVPGGVAFEVDKLLAENVLGNWHSKILERGCFLFRCHQNFSIGGKRDRLALLPTASRDDAIRAMGTNGCNCDVYTEDIIAWLNELEAEQPFVLTGIGMDFLEGKVTAPIQDPDGLARRMYEFCPDIVDQGTGTVEALAAELSKSQKLYFWWD